MIPIGSVAPDFALSDQLGRSFRLSSYRGRRNVLIFFIPAAFTPICGTELPALSALTPRFVRDANTLPVVVTPDNVPTNLAWARTYGGQGVRLLSDWNPHGAVSMAYDAWLPNEAVCDRATVLLDAAGRIRYSESVGKFGKRSVPGLLALSAALNGTPLYDVQGPPALSTRMALDLPVVYLTRTCEHCQNVRSFLQQSGLAERVVIRDVDADPSAMRELLALAHDGGVPLMAWQGSRISGDAAVIAALRRAYRV